MLRFCYFLEIPIQLLLNLFTKQFAQNFVLLLLTQAA